MAKKPVEDDSDLVEEPGQGHNSLAKEELLKILVHIEGLLDERSGITEAIRDAMTVAKSKGLDARAIKEMLKLRALDPEVRREREELRDLYMVAVGLAD